MSHVAVHDLRIVYRNAAGEDVPAVQRADFTLERGETLGIVGESGSGKSTVARALLGFARPGARFDRGTVHVGGTSVLDLDPAAIRAFRGGRAAMVPQNPLSSLTPHMTNGAQLVELIRQHAGLTGAEARERALDLMDATGLPEPAALFGRYPHEISGGQRQRLVIAAALVARPELIVLDEPTTALDKTVEARVLELVRRVQAELDATLVYVSHDLNVISAMCRRVAVMRDGKVLEDKPADALFEAAETAYARTLVAAIPRLGHRMRPAAARAGNGEATLRVDRLAFAYRRPGRFLSPRTGAPKVVDGVRFAVPAGETLGVVGESGSGKSTIAGLIAGMLGGHEGEMRLAGEPISGVARSRTREMRRRIQMVFQDPLSSLNPAHTVEDILIRPLQHYFGLTRAAAHERAASLLAEMDLSADLMARRPRQLSGGQQQRVALARALSAEPDVLLCDEVTSALDVTIQAQVLELLQRLQRDRGIAMVFISHDLAVVSQVSDRILVLERGAVRDHGPAADVLAAPTSAYTRRLLDAFAASERQAPAPLAEAV